MSYSLAPYNETSLHPGKYYIMSVLRVYYNETDYLHLILQKDLRNFYCYADEDNSAYEEEKLESMRSQLHVYTKPFVIYENHSFNKLLCEKKYKEMVESLIDEYGKSWDDITRIVKVEEKIVSDKLVIVNGRPQIKQ